MQEDAQSPSAQHPPLPHPAENGAASHSLAENDGEGTDEEAAGKADAVIAAVVERTLQQAVVSKSMAAGRSGTLGTSDSLEGHVAAESAAAGSPGAMGSLEALSAPVASGAAEDSSPRHISQHPSLTPEGESKAGSSSGDGPDGMATVGAQAQSSSPRKQASLDPSDSSAAADSRPGAKPDPLDTGQAESNESASALAMRERGPASSPAQPKEDAGQVKSSSRPNSAQKKSSQRRSQADSRALEREYLEGELDALGEKEQEEVKRQVPCGSCVEPLSLPCLGCTCASTQRMLAQFCSGKVSRCEERVWEGISAEVSLIHILFMSVYTTQE